VVALLLAAGALTAALGIHVPDVPEVVTDEQVTAALAGRVIAAMADLLVVIERFT
jgi:hypothetical protein